MSVKAKNITETKKREKELESSRDQMQQLNLYLQKVREEERLRIARELHDNLGQALTAIKIDLNWLMGQIPNETEESTKVSGMLELVTDTIRDVQRISSELRPLILDDLGLAAAIEWYCEEFAVRSRLKVEMEINDVQSDLMNTNLAIYRVLQESLTNIIRHAEARNVKVNLLRKKNDIVLKVQDDGKGISADKLNSNKSLGLMGMHERVKQAQGTMEISAAAKGGTIIKIRIPIG